MALMLIIAALTDDEKAINKAVRIVDYYIRRNYIAHMSHSLKKESTRLVG